MQANLNYSMKSNQRRTIEPLEPLVCQAAKRLSRYRPTPTASGALGRRWRNLSLTYHRPLMQLARTHHNRPTPQRRSQRAPGYRSDLITGMLIGIRAGKILAAMAER